MFADALKNLGYNLLNLDCSSNIDISHRGPHADFTLSFANNLKTLEVSA